MSSSVRTRGGRGPTKRLAVIAIGIALAIAVLALPATASAAGRAYWTDNTSQISFGALDGAGGGILSLGGGTLSHPGGTAIDSATGRIYWVNETGSVSFASLDGSGGGVLNTTGATFNQPFGATIDPVGRRIYWANSGSIAYANLDGSGGGVLNTGAAPVFTAEGPAVDPAAGRIYWARISGSEIGYANLDGSGGGALNTTGAALNGPDGVAIDPVTKRLYWSNNGGASPISYANLDNSGGGGNLNVTGGNTLSPRGVAIDPEARRIYWAEEESPGSISYADLGGGGGAVLPSTGASVQFLRFPILQNPPHAISAPALTGTAAIGATLSCSQGGWGGDEPGSQLYRAPSGFSFQWLRDGAAVAGASTASYAPTAGGSYACRLTAANAAGSTAQTSAAVDVPKPPKPHGLATVAGQATVKKGKAGLRMHCPAKGGECRGVVKLVGFSAVKGAGKGRASSRGRRVVLGKRRFRIAPGKKKVVPVKLSGAGLRMLSDDPDHRIAVSLVGKWVKHRSISLLLAG
jgi:DNA-binding beta-propeller fold protein YncE